MFKKILKWSKQHQNHFSYKRKIILNSTNSIVLDNRIKHQNAPKNPATEWLKKCTKTINNICFKMVRDII